MKHLVILLFITNLSFSQGVIDGFFKGKGKLDIALSYSYQKSEIYFAGYNKINYKRELHAIGFFAEGGITDKWDVIVNIPYINGSFQDGGIHTKYHLLRKKIKNTELDFIGAAGISFPLFMYPINIGNAIGQQATQITPKFVFQAKFGNGIFIQSQTGYNYALTPVASSIPFSVKLGLAKNKFYTDVWFDFQEGIGNKDYLGSVPFNSFRELVVSYRRIGGVLYYAPLPRIGVFANFSYTFSGRNTSQAYSIGTGLVCKLGKK